MNRRQVLAGLLAGLAPIGPAQGRDRTYALGYLSGGVPRPDDLLQALAGFGYVEGKNLRYEVRFAPPNTEPAKALAVARELSNAGVDVVYAVLDRAELMAKATRTVPIVSGGSPDPVGMGIAQTLRRPGGNVTGLSGGVQESAEIRFELLRSMRPGLKRVLIFHGVNGAERVRKVSSPIEAAGKSVGVATAYIPVAAWADIENAFGRFGDPQTLAAWGAPGGAATAAMPSTIARADILAFAIRRGVAWIADAELGGLMDYEVHHSNPVRSVARMIDRIFTGSNVGDIPWELPDRTAFVLNRKTARAIGARLTPEILLRATQVIE
jgi:putative ABC transport system substrate-binding protein